MLAEKETKDNTVKKFYFLYNIIKIEISLGWKSEILYGF